MIPCVIFDMDGVIIDSEPIYMQVEQQLFKEIGIELSYEEHAAFAGRSDLWKVLKESHNLDIDVDLIHKKENRQYLDIINHHFNDGPIEGVVEVIERVNKRGSEMVLASSSEMKNIETVLQKFDLLHFFDLRISGADLETSKPHPEIFLKAAKMAHTPPGECLVIEDSANGVRAAKDAGMYCIGFQNPNSGDQNLSSADWIINSFENFDFDHFSLK